MAHWIVVFLHLNKRCITANLKASLNCRLVNFNNNLASTSSCCCYLFFTRHILNSVSVTRELRTADSDCGPGIKREPGMKRGPDTKRRLQTRYETRNEFSKTEYRTKFGLYRPRYWFKKKKKTLECFYYVSKYYRLRRNAQLQHRLG